MKTILFTILILFIALLAMAASALLSKRDGKELKGSCGGPEMNPDCCLNKGKKCSQKENSATRQ